ncbi:MAG TPA: hypothetical protein PKM51_08910 [Chitinophagales bacterium]|nr:hypothetical protein [Chitinophagales bacterium]HNM32861.1 hypothetical protein [Chitinophagales bacterium]
MLETFKYNLLNNWNAVRIIRLVLSIIIIVQSVQIHDALFGGLGAFFMYQALSNTGCCGVNGCAPSTMKTPANTAEEIEFTEVKNNNHANLP